MLRGRGRGRRHAAYRLQELPGPDAPASISIARTARSSGGFNQSICCYAEDLLNGDRGTGAFAGSNPCHTLLSHHGRVSYANNPDWFVAGAYVRKDFDRPHLNWHFLKGDCTDFYDVYGDGVLQAIFTPGHSVGHQSFLVTLPNQKAILIAADAAYTLDHWNERALPALMSSAVDTAHSVRKLRALADRTGALVVPGHDPNEWSRFRLAPAYLD